MSDAPDKPKAASPPAPTLTISPVPHQEPTQSKPAELTQPESTPPPSTGGDHGNARQSQPTVSEAPLRGTSRPFPSMRPRINSLVAPATSTASPLALLYQPVVVEEEAVTDDQEDDQGPVKPQSLISYGPASRRRLASMVPRRRGAAFADSSPATTLSRWQYQDSRQLSQSPPRSDDVDHLSRSPERINPSTLSVPETAEQVLEEEEEEGGQPGLSRRLELMEERQKRIEEMLVKLTRHLS